MPPKNTRFIKVELGDLLVAYLEQLNIDYVFGIPGGAIEPLYNALGRSKRRGGPRPIVPRHETSAIFMADGYYRQTGKLGVCCATTGPGATNLITGAASAYENHIPILIITAQTALANFGRGAFQESSCTGINTVGMFQYCTRYNTLVSHVEQFEHKLTAAVTSAFQSPGGPAHLSIPLDVLRSPSPVAQPSYNLIALIHRPSLLDSGAVDELCRQLDKAKKVVFVIGGGCNETIGIILELALLINATVVTVPHGKGLVSPYHPLFRGVIGFAGHNSAAEALTDPEVDTVVAIGTNLGEWATDGWDCGTLLNDRLIHVDSVERHLTHSPMARLHVRGRLSTLFAHLLEHFKKTRSGQATVSLINTHYEQRGSPYSRGTKGPITKKGHSAHISRHHVQGRTYRGSVQGVAHTASIHRQDAYTTDIIGRDAHTADIIDWDAHTAFHFHLDEKLKYSSDATPIKPQRLMRELAQIFPPNTCFLADTGNSVAWAIHYLHPSDRRLAGQRPWHAGTFHIALEFGSMGWAIGAAIGTALGFLGNPVVCITGDGSLLMSGQEITVAVQEKLPVIFVILNDAALGMVKHGQRLAGAELIGFELPEVDYCAYAKAMGAAGYIIRSPQDLLDLDVGEICKRGGPTLLDVRIDREEIPPMRSRIRALMQSNEYRTRGYP
jgi:acetolactate synthase-1/2/3 large subunit